jgi:membrane protein YqaA with SNARE-associated domain
MHWLPWWAYPAACCVLTGGACGWVLGYLHREFVELGRAYGRLLADIGYLCATRQLRQRGRRNWRGEWR